MRRLTLPFALAAAIGLAGCQSMDADTTGRTVGSAAIGAAGGALIGALAGSAGTGAAIGAVTGAAGGVIYDQYKQREGE
jgi:osmotically inducible lipoprotein OsmB